MAATSPYQGNDYQAVSNYRPYELPINDIFKAVSAQNQFWELGARQIKSVYDNALNLKLSLEPNRQIRDEFMKKAETELNKLLTMNVADPSVQRKAFSVFRPLFKDEGVAYDDAMTRHYEKVRQDALQFRDNDNGKGYSDTNLSYALDGYNEFVNSADRMAGKKFFQKRKEYTPFYDPSSELSSILKNCKPSTALGEGINGMYIRSSSEESLTSRKINSCIDGGLSDRARRQLQINAAVTYKNNPMALRDKYIPHLQGTIGQLSEDNSAIKAILTNKNNLANLKKEDLYKIGISDPSQLTPEYIQSLQNQQDMNEQRIQNMNRQVGNMLAGDLSEIQGDNFEPVAGAIYARDYMQNVAEGFSYDFKKNTLRSDPVQMMYYQQSQLNARQEDDQQHDILVKQMDLDSDLAKYEMQARLKSGMLKGMNQNSNSIDLARVDNDTTSPFASVDKSDSYDQVVQKVQDIVNQRTGVNKDLIKELKNYGLDQSVTNTSDPKFDAFYNAFKVTSKGDPEKQKVIAEYENKMSKLVTLNDLYSGTLKKVDEQIQPLEVEAVQKINNLPAAKESGISFTGDDIRRALTGETVKGLKIVDETQLGSQDPLSPFKEGEPTQAIYLNGKRINFSNSGSMSELGRLVNDVRDIAGKTTSEMKIKRNEVMQRETVLQRPGYLFPELNDKGSDFKKRIAQNIGLPPDYIDDLIIGQTDLNGRVEVTLNTDRIKASQEYKAEDILNRLKTYGGRDNKPIGDATNRFLLEGVNGLDMIDENNLSSMMTPYIRNLENRALASGSESTVYMRSNSDKSYRLVVDRKYDGTFNYKIMSQGNTSPIYSSTNRNDILAQFQELTEKGKDNLK